MNYFKEGKKNKDVQQTPDLLILNFVSAFSIENIKFPLQLKKERINQFMQRYHYQRNLQSFL